MNSSNRFDRYPLVSLRHQMSRIILGILASALVLGAGSQVGAVEVDEDPTNIDTQSPSSESSTSASPEVVDIPNTDSGIDSESDPLSASTSANDSKTVYVIPIREDIMPPLTYLVRRGIKEAIRDGATLLVLDMETNGGRVDVTTDIIEIIEQFPGESVTFVNKKAFSAGAFISVATQKIFMAPGSVIGAAAPIMISPGGGGAQEMPNTMEVKMTSAISAMIRAQCQKNGHDAAVIEAMIDKSRELNIDGEILCDKGQILTLTDSEALKSYGDPPRPLLSSGTLESLEDVLDQMGYTNARVVRVEPTGAEQIGRWINLISPVLLIIGLAGIYLEFKTPGFGLPGMVGLIALMFYFFGAYISGVSGLGWAIIFMVGLIFLMVEMFLVPGTLVSGIVGVLLMCVALVMAMVDLYPVAPAGPPNAPNGIQTEGEREGSEGFGFNVILPDSSSISRAFLKLALAAVGAMGLIYFLGFLIKDTAMYNTLVSHSSSGRDQKWDSGQAAEEWVGAEGVAISPLRPGGKAKIKGKVVDVIADGQMIDAGVKIRVLRHSGMDAVVEPVEEHEIEKS